MPVISRNTTNKPNAPIFMIRFIFPYFEAVLVSLGGSVSRRFAQIIYADLIADVFGFICAKLFDFLILKH
jgi:hypothetical protein